jgi:hypothetical protein
MTFEHDFKDAGRYVGSSLCARSWQNGSLSFSVNLHLLGLIEYILYAVGFFSLVGLMWWMLRAGAKKKTQAGDAIA